MTLPPGTRLGPYEIIAPLGAGGMGEVYRAHDSRLGRDVALKILPAEVAGDASRRARFEQEARAVAALSHPNIVAVYDVGEGYMVSELVEGGTLRTAKFGLRKTLDIAAQIASGLAAAHAAGIVHRDLKPDNVLLTREGRAKILDFGLARVLPSRSPADETMTLRTDPGVVMGTAGYMSPEQVRGIKADHRSDIFSFGVMLHEMLSGQRTFQGETGVDTMQAILRQDPPELPRTVPAGVREVVQHCLEKDAADRFQSARDLGFALHALSQGDSQSEAAMAPIVSAPNLSAQRRTWLSVAILLLAVVVTFVLTRWLMREPPPTRWSAVTLGGTSDHPRLSPDGETLAFASGDNQVGIMTPASGDVSILTHPSENGYVQQVCWSSDGTRIYFDRYTDVPRGIFSVPKLGGREQLLLEDAFHPEALPDGSLLVARYNAERKEQLFRFWPDTGRLQPLPLLLRLSHGDVAMRSFPDGKSAVAFGTAIGAQPEAFPHLYRIQLDSGKLQRLESGLPEGINISALAVTRDSRNVLEAINTGSAGRVMSVPASGRGPARDVLLVTSLINSLDAGVNGSIYIDQHQRPEALVRFSAAGGHAERIADFSPDQVADTFLVLADGRAVLSIYTGGASRLMAVEAGKPPEPLIYTQEENAGPMAPAGPGQIAFLVGTEPRRTIAIGEVATGRITRRIPFEHGQISGLAATPDGKTIFCVADDVVWAIPAAGEATKIRGGNRIAMDPSGKYLLVEVVESPVIRFVRVPLDGGPEQEIPRPASGERPASFITPNAIAKNGRILTPLGTSKWNWPAGILDPSTGRYARIPVDLDLDYHALAWTPDGNVLAIGLGTQLTIWKFTPDGK
ncbi:MAG TPA: protein kinase [Candidatus Sulfotelmatobacter sp.]|jgi:serine/threonine protein kinase